MLSVDTILTVLRLRRRPVAANADLTKLMIAIMECRSIGLSTLEAAGKVIAADARFNMWILRDVKPMGTATSEDNWMRLLEFVESSHRRALATASRFRTSGDNERLAAELSQLAADLDDAPSTKPFWRSCARLPGVL
jgi:hypothetical protein